MSDGNDTAPAEPGPAPSDWHAVFANCGCTVFVGDTVLTPYYFNAVIVSLMFLLSYLAKAVKRRCKGVPTPPEMRGALLLASVWKPSVLLVLAQTIFQLACYGAAASHESEIDVSAWDRYQALYARWINSGATALVVSSVVGSFWMHRMLRNYVRGLRELAGSPKGSPQAAADSEAPLRAGEVTGPEAGQRPGTPPPRADPQGLAAPPGAYAQLDEPALARAKLELLRSEDVVDSKWELSATFDGGCLRACKFCCRQVATCCVVLPLYILLAPGVFTHVLPGFFIWLWATGPVQVLLFSLGRSWILKLDAPLIARLLLLQFVILLHVIAFQATFDFAVLYYNGESYLGVFAKEIELRDPECWYCYTRLRAEHLWVSLSFI